MNSDPVTSSTLLVRIRDAHNADAWRQFVGAYTPLIYDFCRRAGLQEADAADVAQEVMRAVAGAIRKFNYDRQRGRFRTWLLTVTRRKLNDFLARQQRQPLGVGGSALANLVDARKAATDLEKDWDRQYYQHLFDWAAEQVRPQIEERTWQAFLLTTIQGHAADEVATRLGISVGAVYIARCRTLRRLKEVLMCVAEDEWEQGMRQ